MLTTPILTWLGRLSISRRAMLCATSMREGLISLARMLPELSMASITPSSLVGKSITALGRATAKSMKVQQRYSVAAIQNRVHRVAGFAD